MTYNNATSIREARVAFLSTHALGDDGGQADRWVKLKVGPLPLWFPNTAARRRALPIHDLHHLATGYDGSWVGEAEMAAWELAAGCSDYVAAWLLDIGGLLIGLLIAPRRTWRAFRLGRRCESLYRLGVDKHLMEGTVGELRQRLRIQSEPDAAV